MRASPQEIAEARRAPDRLARTRRLAEVMQERAAFGSCTLAQLGAAGFTSAEVFAYIDDARAILADRPGAGEIRVNPDRAEGLALAAKAADIAARKGRAPEPEGAAEAVEAASRIEDDVRIVMLERFGRLGAAILDDLDSAGLTIASQHELEQRRREQTELAKTLEGALPLIDALAALRPSVARLVWGQS